MDALRRTSGSSQLDAALADAREQLAATVGVLRVIAGSRGDAQPVFDAIVAAGVRLFRGAALALSRAEAGQVHSLAIAEDDPERAARWRKVFPFPLSREFIHGAAILERRVVDVPDVLETGGQFEAGKRNLAPSGYRAMTVVPLMSAGEAIGAIAVVRMTPGALSARQIALLQAFADQAVIAIENARLFNETRDALERQTASAEVLQVIGGSMADASPVFEKILDSCQRLFGATDLGVFLVEGGDRLNAAAWRGGFKDWAPASYPRALVGTMSELVIAHGAPRQWADVAAAPDVPEYIHEVVRSRGNFAVAVAPLMWQGCGIGTLDVMRRPPRPYSDKELALLRSFADQAVIAIENARLFKELQARNRELGEALDQQTATSEILRVISRSPTDVQPVFDAIASAAMALCRARSANVLTFDGQLLHLAARAIENPEAREAARQVFPRPAGHDTAAGRAVLTHRIAAIPDVLEDPDYAAREVARLSGSRSFLGVPLMRDGQPIGAIAVGRPEPGAIPEQQIALLQTFADQAVIAIENARLFNQTRQALERQTATSEVLRVISGSVTDTQPVFDVIAERAARLTGAKSGWVFRFDGQWIHAASSYGLTAQGLAAALALFPMRPGGGSYTARAIGDGVVMNVADALAETDPAYATKAVARLAGYRSVLSVPMFRGRQVLGAISVNRAEVGPFGDTEVELLRTFADQAVIAIENTRLTNEREARNRELAEALEQQTATSEILRVIARSPTDVQPVLDAVAERAALLCEAMHASVFLQDGDMLWPRASFARETGSDPGPSDGVPLRRSWLNARAFLDCRAIHVEDIVPLLDTEYPDARHNQRRFGFRAVVAVPMMRHQQAIGTIFVWRREPRAFEASEVALLQTFADQAVIAIENARLFNELQDKTRELEIAGRHKSAFLANMSHELRTPLNAILGFTRIVLRETREAIEPKQAQNLEKILASARHLIGLINATLDLSRIEAGHIEISDSEVALAPLLDDGLRTVEPLLADGVALACRVAPDLPPMHVDEQKLRQIVINLLSNAVKFTERGRIDVRAEHRDGRIEIAVADTGIGIPADKLEAVFEEFEQVDVSHTRAQSGTGLGLAIARRLARAMDGELSATTMLGVGSTFTLDLPLRHGPGDGR